ncbi:MAG: hypothetical protein JWQ02_1630 [Capsulimonas sp.]|nr:hypothetical protein [Capsulimonas sp.]
MPDPNNFDYFRRSELAKSGGDGSFGLDYAVRGEPVGAISAAAATVYALTPTGIPSTSALGVPSLSMSYLLTPTGISSSETFGPPSYTGAMVNQGSLVTQIGVEIAATAVSGSARVTAAHLEVAAQMSGGMVRVTAANAEVAATMSRTEVRVTAISRETAAWMSGANVRVTAISIEYALGPLPPGVVIPPPGTMLDPLPPTCDCCAGQWMTGDLPPTLWDDGVAPLTSWDSAAAPATTWTMPDCC